MSIFSEIDEPLTAEEEAMMARFLDNTIDSAEFPQFDLTDEGETIIEEPEDFNWNAADYIDPKKDAFRCKLKLGEIPFNVAWFDGFTFEKGSKIVYKKGSRMRKAFEAGRRAAK
jgi:hypothetical protein